MKLCGNGGSRIWEESGGGEEYDDNTLDDKNFNLKNNFRKW